jgi:hypothetical protein
MDLSHIPEADPELRVLFSHNTQWKLVQPGRSTTNADIYWGKRMLEKPF